jgi:hypothetical protein
MEPGLQPRRLVSGQFNIIRDSSSPAKQVGDLIFPGKMQIYTQAAELNREIARDFACADTRETIAFRPCAL